MSLSRRKQHQQFLLAYEYAFDGLAKRRNWKLIFSLWYAAASAGHKRAQFYVGTCYDYGKGVEKNTEEAFYWYLKGAMQGHMDAQFNVGLFFVGANTLIRTIRKQLNGSDAPQSREILPHNES